MNNDFSSLQFNKNRKTDASALDLILGMRLVLLAFVLNVGLSILAINSDASAPFLPAVFAAIPGWILLIGWIVSFSFGAYGTYLVVDSFGWSDLVTGILILCLLIPFAKLIVLIIALVKAFELLGKSSYRFSLFGKPKPRAA